MKKIITIVLSFLILFSISVPIGAESEVSLEDFAYIVENTDYYKDYSDSVLERDVFKEVEIEEGIRYTIRYVLEDDRYLVFVGDENGNVLEALLTLTTDKLISVTSLVSDKTSNLHARGPVYECVTVKCDKWERDYSFDPQPACSATVGQPCSDLSVILGMPFAWLICKAGVYIACGIVYENVCTHYYEEWDICEI